MKGRLFLVHWNAAEAEAHAQALRSDGWEVLGFEAEDGARAVKAIVAALPDVVVVYLHRLPSHGRETAAFLRSTRATCQVPIVFVDGQGEALEKTRVRVPDAVYTTSAGLTAALSRTVGLNRVG
ncbi:MAG: hypothetical protein HY688_00345 [Chloroflexi bacterium]|nr:hypothetical protein [Chloroflexota bacterium]